MLLPNNGQHCLTLLGRLIGNITRQINRPKHVLFGLYTQNHPAQPDASVCVCLANTTLHAMHAATMYVCATRGATTP